MTPNKAIVPEDIQSFFSSVENSPTLPQQGP